MAESDPYNEEVQNGVRLCVLLLELGTPRVRALFEQNVSKAAKNLQSLLQLKHHEMSDYLKGKGKPKLLTHEQYAKMYPKGRQVNSPDDFDITLLILLNSILCKMPEPATGWVNEPGKRDLSKSADLVRLRRIRNLIYGHISSMKMSDEKYSENWTQLTTILIRLGATKKQCDRYKTCHIEQAKITVWKDKLFHCIEQDISQIETLCNTFLKAISENKISLTEEINQHVEELKSILNASGYQKNLEMCACYLSSIINELNNSDVLYKTFIGEISPKLDEISKCISSVSSKQDVMMKSVSEKQEEMIQKQDEIKQAVANIPNIHVQPQDYDIQGTAQIQKHLGGIKECFKMLILNSPDPNTDTSDVDELANALGCINWDIIVDLDHKSRSTGVHDKLAASLGRHKDFSVFTYKDVRTVKDEVKNNVARGSHALYILANGCAETRDCEAILDKFGIACQGISRLLEDILMKMQDAKPFVCTILLLSEHGINAASKLQSRLNDVIESSGDIIAAGKSAYIHVCTSLHDTTNLFTKSPIEIVHIQHNYRSLCHALFSVFPRVGDDEMYTFPAIRGGEAYLRKKDVVPILPFLDLYHRNIGEIKYDSMTQEQKQSQQKEIQMNYHKGGGLTPEGLCLSSKSQVYVRRREIDDVVSLVKGKISTTSWRELHKQPFVIQHDASGGGSTVATAVLYELRNEYPCVNVKCIGEKLYQGLEKIYRKSGLPLVILIDNIEMTDSNYVTLKRSIENDQFKALVIKSERVYKPENYRESCANDAGYFVSGLLFSEDVHAFKKLYSQYAVVVASGRVFLYGLQAFLEEHIRFQPHINECLEKLNTCQRLLLRFCCMTWLYASFALNGRLVMTILDASPDEFCGEEMFETMGYAADFLLQTEKGVRPAHIKIITPIMDQMCYTTDKKTQLRILNEDLITVMDKCMKSGHTDIARSIIFMLFVKRNKHENRWWSRFVLVMQNILGNEFEDVLINVIKCCSDANISSHIKVLYSRYLMYKLDRADDSLKQAREACGIKPKETVEKAPENDSSIFANYGNILIKTMQRKAKRGNLSNELALELNDLQQAVLAYKRSQMGKTDFAVTTNRLGLQYNGIAFTGEAEARYEVMLLLLERRFNSDRKLFDNFLQETKNTFIKSCESEAFQALDKMDHLWSLDLLNDDYYDETMRKATKLKFDFLFLHSDNSTKKEVKYHITRLHEDIDCDVGTLVRCFVGRNNRIGKKRNWNQITKEELVFIIQELKRRLPVTSLRSNFEDIILAMIYIRCHPNADEDNCGNLEFAIMCAAQWKTKFPNDHQAHFIYGILTFAKALDAGEGQTREDIMKEAGNNLEKCTHICKEHKASQAFRKRRFYVGKERGLAKIIPRVDVTDPEEDNLHEFDGRLLNKNYVNVRPFPLLLRAGITLDDPIQIAQQKPLVRFNIAFAHDMLRVRNYKMIED